MNYEDTRAYGIRQILGMGIALEEARGHNNATPDDYRARAWAKLQATLNSIPKISFEVQA